MNAQSPIAPSELALIDRLEAGFAPRLAPVYADLRDEVIAFAEKRAGPEPARRHAEVLLRFTLQQQDAITALNKAEALFQTRFASAVDDAEGRAAIIDFARALDADEARIRRDMRALDKFFDADAVQERFRKRLGERQRALAYALERLGPVAGEALIADHKAVSSPFFASEFHELLGEMRSWHGDPRVRKAAHACFRQAVTAFVGKIEEFWLDVSLSATRRVALDETEDGWVQCEAIDALMALSPESVPAVVQRRLASDPAGKSAQVRDNELFVRRHLVRLVCGHLDSQPKLEPSLTKLANDAEGAVRQAFADALHLLPREKAAAVMTRLRTDRDPQVRAAIFADPARMLDAVEPSGFIRHIERVCVFEGDEFVLRIALEAASDTAAWLADGALPDRSGLIERMNTAITTLRGRGLSFKIMRWAAEARERIWLYSDDEAREIATHLAEGARGLREGQTRGVRGIRAALKDDREKVGRAMAVLAQRDFGLSLRPALLPRIQRGEYFRPRLWRILFEWRHSATDKRQAFRHTIARDFYGSMIAPSARMAELAPTKVPGEPLFEAKEGGWRNYLPLLDQVLTALDRGESLHIYTAEGVTRIDPPSGIFRRMRGFWSISNRFAALAALRNRDPAEYLAALRKLWVEVEFSPYTDTDDAPNPEVVKLFNFGGVALALPVLWERALAYVSTVYENNLVELAIFIALASLWFFGRHIALGWRARRLRDGLSLVLGGWGTRGKSGTERLKAGLINALGPSIVSKTTGCEAMFLLGNAYGDLTEMFLFRPYDKATIWEQFNLLKTSRGLGARVFLWECMGLNPAYVRVLQQDWMRDDIGTITNTYPDHEDVQGPAGRNIPEVMCEFIPHDSLLLTTEEEMLPILQQGAEKSGTEIRSIGWKQAGLIHQSLLDRFPYEEHPFNIALVTAMGAELGLSHDFCVREMSDRVVADLGVLKTYPCSVIEGRTLEFVMGQSANERFGAMGNWNRMGFGDHDLSRDPEIYVTTVVNNRADRVPRSRVFARILVQDVAADRHFLIGSNIEGLLGFIEEEWTEYAGSLTLEHEGDDPQARLEELVKQQRIPVTEREVEGRIAAMRRDEAMASAHADAITAHEAEIRGLYQEYAALRDQVARGGNPAAYDGALRDLLGRAFHAKLVPVRDYYISGEAIVRLIARQTPPGLTNRIMGMQNIKGTGLDWVYRWQAWEAVWKACQQLREDDPGAVERGFRTLGAFQEYGVLSEREMRAAIAHLRGASNLPPAIAPQQVDALEARLDEQLAQLSGEDDATGEGAHEAQQGRLSAFGARMLDMTEAFLDAGDAVRRRKASDRIYDALIAEQISSQRAAAELKKLTSRQKGGWLGKSLKDGLGRLRSADPA